MSQQPSAPQSPSQDPLYSPLNTKTASPNPPSSKGWMIGLTVGLVLALIFSLYLLTQLRGSQEEVQRLNRDLADASGRIAKIEEQLFKTESTFSQRLQATNRQFNDFSSRQSETVDRLKTDLSQRATKDDVNQVGKKTEAINSDLGNLKTNVQNVDQSVKQVDSRVGNINNRVEEQNKTLEQHKKMIEDSIHSINATRELLDSTRSSLANLKTSLDRDYYVFQLNKKQGLTNIQGVGLRLKKTRQKEQNYDMEIFSDDKKTSKSKVMVNEPINFYKMGFRKHFEVTILKVGDNMVEGYVSIPKVRD